MAQFKQLLAAVSSLALASCAGLPASGPTAKQVVRATQPDLNAMGITLVDVDAATIAPLTQASGVTGTATTPLAGLAAQGRVDVVGPGDVLQIAIFEVGASLFSGAGGLSSLSEVGSDTVSARRAQVTGVSVDEDGAITMPYVGRLVVAGKTTVQIGRQIEAGLAGKSQSPQVVVTLAQNRASTALVTGRVRTPGRYPLTGARETLLDAIADAGGIVGGGTIGSADLSEDVLVRFSRGDRTVEVPLSDIRSRSADDLVLLPRDRIELVRRERTYTVFGAANRIDQRPFNAPEVSLAEAMARAGGPDDNRADPTAVFVFRYAPGADPAAGALPVIYRVNLMKPSSYFLAQRFQMRDKDVIYVANAGSNATLKLVTIINQLFSPVTTLLVTTATVDNLSK
jgi:polysaccharide export outer membrane protein